MTLGGLLRAFTGLALCWAGAERLLPEGRMRKAAKTIFGLMSLVVWLGGLQAVLGRQLLPALDAPENLLDASGAWDTAPQAALESYGRQGTTLAQLALEAAGCTGEAWVQVGEDGAVAVHLTLASGDFTLATQAIADALGMGEKDIHWE